MSLIKKQEATPIVKLIKSLNDNIQNNGGAIVNKQSAQSFAMEGYNERSTLAGEVETAIQNLESTLKNTLTTISGLGLESLSDSNFDAAVAAGMLAASPVDFYANNKVKTESDLLSIATENMIYVPSPVTGLEKRSIAVEAFDNTPNRNAQVYSIVYNAYASRQDEFGETLFPTIVQTHEQPGYVVSVQLIEVISDIKHAITGAVQDWQRKNIIKALKDSTILDNTSTRLVPVNRAESAALFNTDIGTFVEKVGSEDVTTGALIPGKEFSLLGVSQTTAQVAAGLNDVTDAVDSAVKLNRVYIKLADDDIIKFDTGSIPTFTFNQSVQNNARMLQLAASTSSLQVNNETKQTDGTSLTGAATVGTNRVRLGVKLYGTINQQQGNTFIQAGEVTVEKVFDSTGVELGLSGGAGLAIKNLFAGATVIGYTLDAHRTNSNRRQRGQLIDTRELNYLYAVPVLPPVSAVRPVNASEAQDQQIVAGLIATTRTRVSNASVKALQDAAAQLKQIDAAVKSGNELVEVFGPASHLVIPSYVEVDLDVAAGIDSLTSSQRAEDVTNFIINKIRDTAFRLYRDSNYKAADDALAGGEASKPIVIIATDQVIGRYLTLLGDTRLMGDQFDHKVVTSTDNRMKGKLYVTFGKQEALTSGSPNPMHFGNMAWKPELTLVLPNTRNGAQVMEMTVQPMFLHVPNLPVLGVFNISGIEDIIADKVAINNNPV